MKHIYEARSRKARHIQGALGEAKGQQSKVQLGKGKQGKSKGSGNQEQQDKNKDKNKKLSRMLDLWKARSLLEALLEQEGPDQHRWFKTKGATDAHNHDSTKPVNKEPKVGGFNVDVVALQEADWSRIGVGSGVGKTGWPQSATHGKRILVDVHLTFQTATGELVMSCKRLCVEGCDDWKMISEFEVSKNLYANHSCLSVKTRRWLQRQSCMVTRVTCSTRLEC